MNVVIERKVSRAVVAFWFTHLSLVLIIFTIVVYLIIKLEQGDIVMANEDTKPSDDSSGSNHGTPNSGQPSSDSVPNENVQAPKSGWFKKSLDDTTPREDLQAPESKWLREGLDIDRSDLEEE